MMKKLITVHELEKHLKISRRSVYRYIDKKIITFGIKIDGDWRFLEENLIKWLIKEKINLI